METWFKKEMFKEVKRIFFPNGNEHYEILDEILNILLTNSFDNRKVFLSTKAINYNLTDKFWLVINLEDETFKFIYDDEVVVKRLLTIEDLKRATTAYFEISGIDLRKDEDEIFYIALRNSISVNVLRHISPYSEIGWKNY